MGIHKGDDLGQGAILQLAIRVEQKDVFRRARRERAVAGRGKTEVRPVLEDLHAVAVARRDEVTASVARTVVGHDHVRKTGIGTHFVEGEDGIERDRHALLVVPTYHHDVDPRHNYATPCNRGRCCKYGHTNVSISPSRTAWTLPV